MGFDFNSFLQEKEKEPQAPTPTPDFDFNKLMSEPSKAASDPRNPLSPKPKQYGPPLPSDSGPKLVGEGKSALDRAIGQFMTRAGETAAGIVSLPGAIAMAGIGGLSGDPTTKALASAHQEGFKEAGKNILDIMSEDPAKARKATGSFLGAEWGKAAESMSLEPLGENPGGALFDLVTNAPQIAMPLAAGALGAGSKLSPLIRKIPKVGNPIVNATNRGVMKVVPKWMWPEEMTAADIARQGDVFYRTVTDTGPAVQKSREIEQYMQNVQDRVAIPTPATHFLAPKLRMSDREMRNFNKSLVNMGHLPPGAIGPQMAGGGIPFTYRGRNLHLSVDAQGFVTYGHADDFAKLPPDIQLKIQNVRQVIDTNHQMMASRGIISAKDQAENGVSYIHRMYNVFTNPDEWQQRVLHDPAMAGVRQRALQWIYKNTESALNPGNRPSPTEVHATFMHILQNSQEIQLNPDKLFAITQFGPDLKALKKRVSIPKPIEDLLGPVGVKGAEFATPASVGQTIDMQIRILANDAMMERLLGVAALDGRPLVVARPGGRTKAMPFADGRVLEDNRLFGRFANAWVHPDIEDAVRTMTGNTISGTIRDYISAWKAGKVTWNVPTHINNIISDLVFSVLAGHSPTNPMNIPNFVQASRDMANFYANPAAITQLPHLAEAVKAGAVVPGFASREIANLYAQIGSRMAAGPVDAIVRTMIDSKAARVFAKAYDFEDQFYRYAAFINLRKKGMTPEAAAVEIANSFPNYETSSKLGAFLRGQDTLQIGKKTQIPGAVGSLIGGPFVSFPLEAARIMANAAAKHPVRLMAASSIPMSLTVMGAAANGMTLADYHSFLKELPPHEQGKMWIPVPHNGKTYWLDMSPGFWPAQWMNHSETLSDLAGVSMPQGPFNDLVIGGLPLAMLELLKNQDTRTGQQIWDPDKGDSWADWLARMIERISPAPSMVLKAGRGVKAAVQGTTINKYDEEPPTVGSALGQAVSPFRIRTPEELENVSNIVQRGHDAELRKNLRRINRDPRLTDEQKDTRRERIQERRERVRENR